MPTGLAHVLLRWKIWACLDLKPTVAEAFVQRCEIKKKNELPFMRLRIKKGRKGVKKKGRKMIAIFVIQYPDENVGNNG